MKKQANQNVVGPSAGALEPVAPGPKPEALTSSEISLALPDPPASFKPLPTDYALTCPVPEADPSVPLPEYRESQAPFEEESTLAMPIRELNPIKTADIPPALLPDAQSRPVKEAQGLDPRTQTTAVPTPSAAKNPNRGNPSGGSRKRWLGAGILGFFLVAGTALWYLWPQFQPKAKDPFREAAPESAPALSGAVPPELRSYMELAKGGDAKAMHLIALMYWNGLNVKQDRGEGLAWYRKAAAAGDKAAQKELSVIEGK